MVDRPSPPDEGKPTHPAPEEPAAPAPAAAESATPQWSRVKALFLEALEQPESERCAWVRQACAGDEAIEAEVVSLLASDRAAADFGETPAAAMLRMDALPEGGRTPRIAPGARLGNYEITAFVSAGGMGEVYRARHTILGRDVAIKTTHLELSDPAGKRRLTREARHAAVLSHRNICTIHEVSEADGIPFIVMGFVDGRPLNRILQEARLPPDTTFAFGIQLADALEHAHQQGIVHRDLKSTNVVVDGSGRPIILDFGLAKREPVVGESKVDSTVTVAGGLAGTPSHMAPEVLLGGEATARSDIWSLGVLLYELVTGELPFQGRTPYETTSSILNEPPRPIGNRVPLALRLVIERCLVKDPDARYQRAAHVRDALSAIRRRRAWPLVGRLLVSARRRTLYAGAAAAALVAAIGAGGADLGEWLGRVRDPHIRIVAFLPLENATADPDLDYYASGLTDALIQQLGMLTIVRVISPTSAGRAATAAATRADAARSLNAEALIEGRLRQASDRIAVDIRLTDAERGRVLWSDTYERSAQQVLALQADVIRALATQVRLTVRRDASDRLGAVRAVNPEAYEAYLKGRYEWNQRTQGSLERAIQYFNRTAELDPTYAPAHAALADCYNQFGTVMVGTGSPLEYRPLAAAAAIRALQIDPYSAEAHAALGYVRHYDWQWEEAEREFRRAIELNPSYALARIWYANLLMSRGRMDEAVGQVMEARELDPFSLVINTNVGWVLTYAGRTEEAIAVLTRTLELDSTYLQARSRLVDALSMAGRYSEARAQAERHLTLSNRSHYSLKNLALVLSRMGDRETPRVLLRELETRARLEYVPPAALSWMYSIVGDVEPAIHWLTRAFEERSNAMVYIDIELAFESIRNDPRYPALRARVGLP